VPREVDQAVLAVARSQNGNIRRDQLLALGLGSAAIAYRARTGVLHRVHVSVYGVGRPPSTPLERAAAAVLACGPGALLSDESALTLWGLTKRWRTPFHVTVSGDRRPRQIVVHQRPSITRLDTRRQLGIPVTSPARTLLDCAPQLAVRRLSRLVNDARLGGLLRMSELADVMRRFPRHPGAQPLARLLDAAPGPTRSELEDAFLVFCERFHLPQPKVNTRVCGYEVDALFERERVIVELDGWDFHRDRPAFESDRNRDADTLLGGYATVRLTWERMTRAPHREAQRLSGILEGRRRS
jgi:very-short-patch-repair endonuclease